MFMAAVCRAPPRQKMMDPMRIVNLRPNLSPMGPANRAPKKAPPVKTDTTAPLTWSAYYTDAANRATYRSSGLSPNLALKFSEAMASAMTPRS